MKERLKKLRNTKKYTQQTFANELGIQRSTYAKYETGQNEPPDAVIRLICQTFNVNEDWLRNGTGKMEVEISRDDELQQLIGKSMSEESGEFKRRLALAIMKLTPEQIKACTDWIKDNFNLMDIETTDTDRKEQLIKEKVASYEAELRAEFASKESQGASLTGSTGTESHKAI